MENVDQRVFENIIQFPDAEAARKYESLVGLDDIKNRLLKESKIMLFPTLLAEWSVKKFHKVIPLVKLFDSRHSLFILTGDTGTGKTTLAETFGDAVARENRISIGLFSISLSTRGNGGAGEMTRYMSNAFQQIRSYTEQLKTPTGAYSSACILVIDEADALAQSREYDGMQHEDRAAVDGFIQGIDSIAKARLPVITVMCTNRYAVIDQAVKRRAAATFLFRRPDEEQRIRIFRQYLADTGLTEEDIRMLAGKTGTDPSRSYGYTYSDIIQKVLPALVLESFPSSEITAAGVVHLIDTIPPTPPMREWTS